MKNPKISILILNWNGLHNTIECLRTVEKISYPNCDILVIDNGSTDRSVEHIINQFPGIKIIENNKNLGYAGGNNIGIRYAIDHGAEYILLLNNDTVVDPQLLKAFLKASQDHPEYAIFNPKVYYYSTPDKIWSLGINWNKQSGMFLFKGDGLIDDGRLNNEPFEIDYAIGCCLFFDTRVIERIGLFEPKFFLFFEEYDWCSRARIAGYKCLSVPEAKIWHKGSAGFEKESPLMDYYLTRNRLLWAKRNLPFPGKCLIICQTMVRVIYPFPSLCSDYTNEFPAEKGPSGIMRSYIRMFTRRIRWRYYKAVFYGVRDYLLGRFGDCAPDVRKRINPMNPYVEEGQR